MTKHPTFPPGVTVFERGWLSSNNILLEGEAGNALIDSGYGAHAAQTLALVHGEDKAREALAGEIGERDGIEVVLARPGLTLDV